MSIEQLIAANTAALEANTAALLGAKTATSTAADKPAKAAADKPTKATAKPKSEHTREEMVAVLGEVKEKHGTDVTRALFQKEGVAKMAEIADADIDSIYAAAKAKLEAEEEM